VYDSPPLAVKVRAPWLTPPTSWAVSESESASVSSARTPGGGTDSVASFRTEYASAEATGGEFVIVIVTVAAVLSRPLGL
jgi:hypothetical protein